MRKVSTLYEVHPGKTIPHALLTLWWNLQSSTKWEYTDLQGAEVSSWWLWIAVMVSWSKGQELPFLSLLFQSSTIPVSQEVYKIFLSLDSYVPYICFYHIIVYTSLLIVCWNCCVWLSACMQQQKTLSLYKILCLMLVSIAEKYWVLLVTQFQWPF
jgi:hypothetical protein